VKGGRDVAIAGVMSGRRGSEEEDGFVLPEQDRIEAIRGWAGLGRLGGLWSSKLLSLFFSVMFSFLFLFLLFSILGFESLIRT
jgi:hypothetical protein